MPISSAAAACADADARLPLPVNDDQTRIYRAMFDELGANGTVALRTLSSLIDSDSGEALSYNGLKHPNQYVGMASTAGGETEWIYQSKTAKVYAVCEKMTCHSAQLPSNKNFQKIVSLLKTLDKITKKQRKRRSQCSSSLFITSDTVIDTMPVNGTYYMSSTIHNGHSIWESTVNDMVLFKGTSGAWQFDRTIESDTENHVIISLRSTVLPSCDAI